MGVRFHDAGRPQARPPPGPGLQHLDLLLVQHPLRQRHQQQQQEAMYVQRGPVAELEQLRPWELSLPGGVGRSGQPLSAAPRLDAFASLGMGPGAGAPPPPLLPYPPMHPHFHEQHASLPAAGAAGRKSKVDGLHKRGVALAEGLIHGCPLVPVA
eukprot:SM000010S04196  [mRNA]  locus=s10:149141:151130:- [translate_table: standard]